MNDQQQSRADALTSRMTEFDVLLDGYQEALQDGPLKERAHARNELRRAYRTALLAAFPVEQPAEAPFVVDQSDPLWPKHLYENMKAAHEVYANDPPPESAPIPANETGAEGADLADFLELIDNYQCAQKDGTEDERARARIALIDAYRAVLSRSPAMASAAPADEERQKRYARSMMLYDIGIAISIAATICGVIGMARWPFLIATAILLPTALAVYALAKKISPYK
ncbi:hypothetical protein WT24_18010 [Burkholderia sp. MSMB1078WGS]|uniref:hypothetical protein n=1 Tax=Burkholderia sp. MSMB1078WGS TaxID=1637900 RepID=UPI000757964D|nr:hypothetical protein [Burkholderia sp. MSMB1078WGS]KVT07670.1 hypothetical protein WT24_18010 [Burkholderia sp. MSMB1078WGS]